MAGVKKFINNTYGDLKVVLIVRSGSEPGDVFRRVKFCIEKNETRIITYGNNENPFLDGIRCCTDSKCQYSEAFILVTRRGTSIDNLLNTNNTITFTTVNNCIVMSGTNT